MLVKKSEVKTFVLSKSEDVRISSDFYEELSNEVGVLIEDAIIRAVANGRKTLKKQDV